MITPTDFGIDVLYIQVIQVIRVSPYFLSEITYLISVSLTTSVVDKFTFGIVFKLHITQL